MRSNIFPHTAPNSRVNTIKALLRADPDLRHETRSSMKTAKTRLYNRFYTLSASKALLNIPHRMNGNTYHVGWVACLLVCGGRLGVRSILRWSSTNGTGASILAAARVGIACVSLRRGGTDRSFPYFNSALLQQRGPPAARTPVKTGQKGPQ